MKCKLLTLSHSDFSATAFRDKRERGAVAVSVSDVIPSDLETSNVFSRQSPHSTICHESRISKHNNPREISMSKRSLRFKSRELTTEMFVEKTREMDKPKVKGFGGTVDYTWGVLND